MATFVCENESTESIEEALEIIQKRNPEFRPKFFMTKYCNEEIAATENILKVQHKPPAIKLYTSAISLLHNWICIRRE